MAAGLRESVGARSKEDQRRGHCCNQGKRGLHQVGGCGGGRRPGRQLKVEPTGLAGRLRVGCEGKKTVRFLRGFNLCYWKNGVVPPEICTTLKRARLRIWVGKIKNSVLAMSGLRCLLDIYMEMWNNQSLELRGEGRAGDTNFRAFSTYTVSKLDGSREDQRM